MRKCNMSCLEDDSMFNCCEGKCYRAFGFLSQSEIADMSDEDKLLVIGLWRYMAGFLTTQGCSLPERLRSKSCLNYVCGKGEL